MDERPGVSPRIRRFALVVGGLVWLAIGAVIATGFR